MRSLWGQFETADRAARAAHAARVDAIGRLLETFPALSLASMISSRSQVSPATARAWVREAAELGTLPAVAEAYADGRLSGDQVGALRVLADGDDEQAWLETLDSPLGADDFRIDRLLRLARRTIAARLERTDAGRYFKMAPTPDERFVRGRFQLHPEEAAALEAGLDARVPPGTPWSRYEAAHADALMRLVGDAALGAAASDHTSDIAGPGDRAASASDTAGRGDRAGTQCTSPPIGRRACVGATVVIRSDADVLAGRSAAPGELTTGNFVPAPVVRALAASGRVRRVAPAAVVAETDAVPADIRRWVWHRDAGRCRGIDCTTPTTGLEVHHIRPRHDGGSHASSNLILLCWQCHHVKVHRLGWSVVGDADGAVTWLTPHGDRYRPPPIVKRARAPTAR